MGPEELASAFDLSGKVAVITGGSRGLGLEIGRAYARAGARLVIASRKADACERVAAEIQSDVEPFRFEQVAEQLRHAGEQVHALQVLVGGERGQVGNVPPRSDHQVAVIVRVAIEYHGRVPGALGDEVRSIVGVAQSAAQETVIGLR